MRRFVDPVYGSYGRAIILILAWLSLACAPVHACTIFVLTDENHSLFCNNEDWLNSKTRIWFVPAGKGYFGCAYVGFDDGTAQGGVNTQGLAYDVVAGFSEGLADDPTAPRVRGNPAQRMLETCSTVADAIAFQRTYGVGFGKVRMLVADKTGASVILGGKGGTLLVDRATQCRGFGYGAQVLEKMLAKPPEPTVANGARILRACLQTGQYATKYSNVYDLKTGDIFLYPFPDRNGEVKLNLTAELEKGGHYYDMPQISEQLSQKPRLLLTNMKRFLLDEFKPIPDLEPKVTAHTYALFQDALNGTLRRQDFTEESWRQEAPIQKEVQGWLRSFGELGSLILVDRRDEDGQRHYRYRVQFSKATVLFHFIFDEQGRHAFGGAEDVLWKGKEPGA